MLAAIKYLNRASVMDKLKNLESLLKNLEFNLLLTLKQDSYLEIDVDIIAKVGSPVLL